MRLRTGRKFQKAFPAFPAFPGRGLLWIVAGKEGPSWEVTPLMTSEASEQIALVRKLRAAGILFCAVPNGGKRSRVEATRLRMGGVEPGVPDLLIFDRPPLKPQAVGVALEMKRSGAAKSSVRKQQRQWLAALEARGWVALVGYGCQHALIELRSLGYTL